MAPILTDQFCSLISHSIKTVTSHSDPKVLVAGKVFTSSTETSPKVLYFSDVSLHKGYIYGTQLLASSAGSVDLEVCIRLIGEI